MDYDTRYDSKHIRVDSRLRSVYNTNMDISEKILDYAKINRKFRTSDVVNYLNNKYSRSYISEQLSKLSKLKKLVRAGSGAQVYYALPENLDVLIEKVHRRFINHNLKEHEIIEELSNQTPFLMILKDNVRSIFDYAFSEMLNNAIEHSQSEYIEVDVTEDDHYLTFVVKDFGVGVFRNIMGKHKLRSELEAIQDLLKGKATTQPQSHSGEGIFFTSKTADIFILESFGYRLTVENEIKDTFIEEITSTQGTRVTFKISLKTPKHLNDIFNAYQAEPDSYAFDKTEVLIKLYRMGSIHISRSQARRVLSKLEKFKKIVLDFDQVPTIGQAFADEIFRVYRQKHPEIEFVPINMSETVKFMIERVDINN